MRKIIFAFTFSGFFSCEQPQMPPDKNIARVSVYGGKWHVFINSKPVQSYIEVGKENLNVLLEGVEQKQKFKDVLKGMVGNVSFNDKLNNMLERVNSNPAYQDADGIMFNGGMDECMVIKFK